MARLHRQRVVVVRECLWKLTDKDFYSAAVLGQLLYWTLRTKDIDEYLAAEAQRMAQEGDRANVEATGGWVYKSAAELSEELLQICSRPTVNRRLDALVEAGWLERRNNPNHQWDRTLQYRPDLRAIDEGLQEMGYSLEDALPEGDWAVLRQYQSIAQSEQCNAQGEQSNAPSEQCNAQDEQSNAPSEQAIPETTTENTAEKRDSEAAAGSTVMCSIHNKTMQLRTKGDDQWYSHQLRNGTWCKGAPGDQPGDSPVGSEEDRRRYLEWSQ